jgi:RNA polymerase sigma-70 factor (ECF subfamily)
VYREHAQFVWRVVIGMGVPPHATEDVVHDVFLVVQRRFADFEPGRPIRAWLAGIVRNVVLHRRRSHSRRARWLESVPPAIEQRGPEEQVALREAAQLMQDFLAELDDDKRLAFVLVDIEGMKAVDVATACECAASTVYSRLTVARAALQRYLERIDASSRGGARRDDA